MSQHNWKYLLIGLSVLVLASLALAIRRADRLSAIVYRELPSNANTRMAVYANRVF